MGAKPADLREINPVQEKVSPRKKSKKTKRAKRASAVLGGDLKISTGHPGNKRNSVIGLVSERRPAKMGVEILTAKPRVGGLRGTQVGCRMIQKNKNLIEKHLNKPKNVSTFGSGNIRKASGRNLAVVKEKQNRQLDENWSSENPEDIVE